MFQSYSRILLFCCFVICIAYKAPAQHSANDTIMLGAIVVDNDTFPMVYLPDFIKTETLPRRLARRREVNNRLRYNIYKVYPYAVIAAEVLKDVDVNLEKYEDNKKDRKAYLKSVEKELNRRFKGDLEDMTIGQGQILVRLIDRQTGKNCYSIIRELKGGFSAIIAQSIALLFSNNLKREYEPYNRDKEIEAIVAELEANSYYQFKYQRQQALLQSRAK